MKHFITIAQTPVEDLRHVFDVGFALRDQRRRGVPHEALLAHKTLAMIFEKPSLRTRVSFEQAVFELGGRAIVMSSSEVGLGKRESAADVARVLGGMVHGIMDRVFEHQKLLDLAQYGSVPVVNALSDHSHPCQVLADAMTIMDEFGRDLSGRTVAFVGDGNNVARSLAALCEKLGIHFVLATPPGYELDPGFGARAGEPAGPGGPGAPGPRPSFTLTRDPAEAVRQADAIYTDTWVSMGQEAQAAKRKAAFLPYQVNAALLAHAPAHAIVLHCLPAYRECEITAEVLEGPRSRVFPQAHNRLHVQKGLLAVLMGGA